MEQGAPVFHTPVMLEETVQALAVQPGGRYIDATVGTGGHAAAILEHSYPGGQLLGIDADPQAIRIARERLTSYVGSCLLINDNFANLEAICIKYDFFPVHGILFDLGISSLQLDSAERGFSFRLDGPLDMRFSPKEKLTAADIVNTYSRDELARLIWTYGEERYSRRIADHIARKRPIRTTLELARIIEEGVPGRGKIHPATRTFQALRIAVNHELSNLESALNQAINLLGARGRLVVISYHSLEDRIVKQFMQTESRDCICPPEAPTCTCEHIARLRLITRKVIGPSPVEIEANPRSRSAKLRAAERIVNREEVFRTIDNNGLSSNFNTNGWRRPAMLRKLRAVFAGY